MPLGASVACLQSPMPDQMCCGSVVGLDRFGR